MHEHQHGVRKHARERVEREHVFGRFQDPASRRFARSLKMAEEPRKEPIAIVVVRRVESGSIGRGAIHVVEARTARDLDRELDAFLRGVGLDRSVAPRSA
jgi:hypothetical protein